MNKKTLVIGIGQLGSAAVDAFARLPGVKGEDLRILALDTDMRTEERLSDVRFISLAEHCRISDVLDHVAPEHISSFFPCDRENDCAEYFETLRMDEGSNQWRMKALLSLYNLLSKHPTDNALYDELKALIAKSEEPAEAHCEQITEDAPIEVDLLLVASLAGGTGSGLFLPLDFLLKRTLRELGVAEVNARAMLLLPDLCEDYLTAEQQLKARANSYAAIRELNAVNKLCFGKCAPFPFRIGQSDDPVFGVLYDAELPEFQKKEAVPFSDVCLCRRVPAVRSLSGQISCLADKIDAFLKKEQGEPDSPAVFSAYSVNKTRYSAEALLGYIATAYLCDTANEKWMPYFKASEQTLSRTKRAHFTAGKRFECTPDELSEAVMTVAQDVTAQLKTDRGFSLYSADGYFEDFDYSCSDYSTELHAAFDRLLSCEGSEQIEKLLAEDTASHQEALKNSIFDYPKRKKELAATAKNCLEWLEEYYTRNNDAEWMGKLPLISPSETAPSLLDGLLKENGQPISPTLSLLRLSALYRMLKHEFEENVKPWERAIQEEATRIENIRNKDDFVEASSCAPTSVIPPWFLKAQDDVHANCKYDTLGRERFARLLFGDTRHIKGSAYEKVLFCYDLGVTYHRMRAIFLNKLIEEALRQIGELLVKSYTFLTAFNKVLETPIFDLAEALSRDVGHSGTIYRIGSSAEEKKYHYNAFSRDFFGSEASKELSKGYDIALGQLLENRLMSTDAEEDHTAVEKQTEKTLSDFFVVTVRVVSNSEYYKNNLEKNILDAVLAQNGKNGADDAGLAVAKAFSSGIDPICYEFPGIENVYTVNRAIKRSVLVQIPEACYRWLAEKKPERSPEKTVLALLSEAGEYEAEFIFRDTLPKNELHVVRAISGLRPELLEAFNCDAQRPLYYKAYHKAIDLEEEQGTFMWEPHLVRSVCAEALPPLHFCDGDGADTPKILH